ncbi:MAG: Fibronectin type III domain protein [Candidatus Jorgensenbacteria bacterium GW2011_GWA1_48_11]|uniref:Fibronectin type III domain protein n=1 Tax=Candidatus Jorgensenbacteria bacterium GW2011_GWA1_48_11 TaxID=1618660 RepID=A0A0G1WM31_9BACT|nr:MAG: Fibronectin type III domain protein [Candidatus Jorgensenbacteria bacterium GW2011_GWA1_48_11]KKW11893.1 MAG: Fibronectin type III domain protein [Candidatus Jorgensenbacteria bacterium GW2011_GWB1_49_9]
MPKQKKNNCQLSVVNCRSGQSLVEIMIGLGLGAVLIGAASLGITFMLRSSASSQNYQKGGQLAGGLFDKVSSWSSGNWQNIYGLIKGTSTQYFLNASGTALFSVQGQEGMLDNDVTSGLVGEWKFDEATSTTAYDSTGDNKTGTLTNGPVRTTSGCQIGYCLLFDGTSTYVNAPATSSYSNDVTASVWFKGGGQTASDWNYWMNSTINWLEFGTFSNGAIFKDNNASGTPSVSAGTTFVDNNWHHAVGIIRSNVMEIWIDGQLLGSRSDYPTGQSHSNVGIRIGGNGVARGWAGYIDDARIYNSALSAAEVGNLYRSTAFIRYFTVENVCRTNNSSSSISGVAPCGGGSINDPSTQKISVYTSWLPNNTGSPQLKLSNYITRWQNQVFNQSDWTGGAGQDGPFTSPGRGYSTGTNIDGQSNPGSIQILDLTP